MSRIVIAALVLTLAGVDADPALAAIYRCRGDGAPAYSQFCPPADRESVVAGNESGEFLRFSPLTAAEQAALKALDAQLAARQQAARTHQERQRGRARAAAQAAKQRCSAATSALSSLRAKLRKGYDATEAAALKARERELAREQRAHC